MGAQRAPARRLVVGAQERDRQLVRLGGRPAGQLPRGGLPDAGGIPRSLLPDRPGLLLERPQLRPLGPLHLRAALPRVMSDALLKYSEEIRNYSKSCASNRLWPRFVCNESFAC